MGLYRIQLKPGYRPRVETAMESLGMRIVRVERKSDGMHFFYIDPKKKTEFSFWTTKEGEEEFWYCGVSSSSTRIVDALESSGIFEKK